MKNLNIVGFVAFVLGLFVATLLKTSYAQLEEMLSHIQLLAVKIGSTMSLIMLITWVLRREFRHLFARNDQQQASDGEPAPNTQRFFH